MATSEALIKYYDCLKDSFNKIQDKNNETALVNAALRPKIREEFDKDQNVLISYLNYIQVFSLIYSDKFAIVCNTILTPLFKLKAIRRKSEKANEGEDVALRVHSTISTIVKARTDLAEDFVHSVVKVFPAIPYDQPETKEQYLTYYRNSLQVCTYLEGGPLKILISKILDRMNPPVNQFEAKHVEQAFVIVRQSYDIMFEFLSESDNTQNQRLVDGIISIFVSEFIASPNQDELYYLLLYVCSISKENEARLLDSLWSVFEDDHRSLLERKGSLVLASCFLSRAKYVELKTVFEFLEKATNECKNLGSMERSESGDKSKISLECFYAATQAVFYVITQRYREMYEAESINRLIKLDLDRIIESRLKPLEACDFITARRFKEVATLYHIASTRSITSPVSKKPRKSLDSMSFPWKVPIAEQDKNNNIHPRVKHLYRGYYDHRNFTVYRE